MVSNTLKRMIYFSLGGLCFDLEPSLHRADALNI